jgi:hypothetical protein
MTDLDMATPANQTPVQPATQATPATPSTVVLPQSSTLLQAAKIAIEQDRPILLDYYRETAAGTAFLGQDKDTKERILVKNKEEFTSLIKNLYKVGDDFIILTENSLYVVSGKIQKRSINLASLQDAYQRE